MKINKLVNCIDVETTCWELPEVQDKDEIQEIIEIDISVIDTEKLEIISSDSILVKPQHSKVSNFCTKLTSLTQEEVDGTGVLLTKACDKLVNHFQANERVWISWGDFDKNIFNKNCQDYDIKYPFGVRHLNIKNAFALLHGLKKEFGMDAALEYCGISLEGIHHRAIWDALNIAKIYIHTLTKFRK